MNVAESQQKDAEIMAILDDSPLGARTEVESPTFALVDLLNEIWRPERSATRNLRDFLASVSRYLTNQRDTGARRAREGEEIRSAITELYGLWLKEGPVSPTCSVDDMYRFVRAQFPSKVYSSLVKGLMTHDTFYEWISEHESHVNGASTVKAADASASRAVSTDSPVDALASRAVPTDHAYGANESREDEENGGGFDALFDLSSDRDLDRVPQYVSSMKDRRLFTLRSPGEIGSQLVRMDVFDVKDIVSRDKREWWRYAKVRAQFLTSLSRADRKRQLMLQMMDLVADDLKKVPGIQRETKNLTYESGRGNF